MPLESDVIGWVIKHMISGGHRIGLHIGHFKKKNEGKVS